MGFGQTFGRVLFIVFLVVRGAQHVQRPDDWTLKFNQKYREYFDVTAALPFIKENVPANILRLFHPEYLSVFVGQYGPYIGYTELLTAACILLQVPLLPLIGATLLLVETVLFFNPVKQPIGNELYYFIIYVAIVGIVYMMAFAPPLIKVDRIKESIQKKVSSAGGERSARDQSKGQGKTSTERTGSQGKRSKRD